MPLDDLFKVSKGALDLIDHVKKYAIGTASPKDHHKFEELFPQIKEVLQSSLEFMYTGKKPFCVSFENLKRNLQASKNIQVESVPSISLNNISSIIQFMNHVTFENGKEIALLICQGIQNGRTLVGEDLANLFRMFDQYAISEECLKLQVILLTNLQTLNAPLINLTSYKQNKEDEIFQSTNELIKSSDYQTKLRIIKKYEHLFRSKEGQELARKDILGLSSLSAIMADVFDQYSDEEVLVSIRYS